MTDEFDVRYFILIDINEMRAQKRARVDKCNLSILTPKLATTAARCNEIPL